MSDTLSVRVRHVPATDTTGTRVRATAHERWHAAYRAARVAHRGASPIGRTLPFRLAEMRGFAVRFTTNVHADAFAGPDYVAARHVHAANLRRARESRLQRDGMLARGACLCAADIRARLLAPLP